MSAALAAALYGLFSSADDAGAAGAFVAFGGALAVWAWIELAFLTGFVTGPRRIPCGDGARGLRRFVEAAQTVLYHEIALVAGGAAIWLASAGGANRVGIATFAVLWAMRLSTKLNLFLGVPNHAQDLLPRDLAYLGTYFAKRPMNALFPVSVTAGTLAAGWIWQAAFALPEESSALAGHVLVAAIATLGVIEHWILVLPLDASALWRWGLNSRRTAADKRDDCGDLTSMRLAPRPVMRR